jgi:hypothetical protein
MTISMQTLNDALIAIGVTVGIAVFLSIVMIAVGGLFEHNKNLQRTRAHPVGSAQHVTQDDDSRQLILR